MNSVQHSLGNVTRVGRVEIAKRQPVTVEHLKMRHGESERHHEADLFIDSFAAVGILLLKVIKLANNHRLRALVGADVNSLGAVRASGMHKLIVAHNRHGSAMVKKLGETI